MVAFSLVFVVVIAVALVYLIRRKGVRRYEGGLLVLLGFFLSLAWQSITASIAEKKQLNRQVRLLQIEASENRSILRQNIVILESDIDRLSRGFVTIDPLSPFHVSTWNTLKFTNNSLVGRIGDFQRYAEVYTELNRMNEIISYRERHRSVQDRTIAGLKTDDEHVLKYLKKLEPKMEWLGDCVENLEKQLR